MVTISMMSTKMATLGLLKIMNSEIKVMTSKFYHQQNFIT